MFKHADPLHLHHLLARDSRCRKRRHVSNSLSSNTLLLTPAPDKNPAYDVETFKYHGYGLVEAWIGRDAVNIGDMFGSQLYDTMFKRLAQDCPEDWNPCDLDNTAYFDTRYVKNMDTGELGWGE